MRSRFVLRNEKEPFRIKVSEGEQMVALVCPTCKETLITKVNMVHNPEDQGWDTYIGDSAVAWVDAHDKICPLVATINVLPIPPNWIDYANSWL